MRAIFVLALAACALSAEVTMESFRAWAVEHGKTYTAEEEAKRFAVFQENADIIEKLNAEYAGQTTFGFNQFSDLTNAEFAARFTPFKPHNRYPVTLPTVEADTDIDWVAKKAVTPVKDQGQCGSCWAFSTTGSVEGATFLKSGALPNLSEQQLVDCSKSYGNQGCNGGLMDDGFKYIIAKKGLCSEADYKYTAKDGTCKTTCKAVAASAIANYSDVTPNSDTQLYAALAKGPVSIAIEADKSVFQNYKSGVINSTSCGTNLDHGVLLVGYNVAGKYWNVKNSWGASWGLQGYVHIARTTGKGVCGINSMASFPHF